MDERTVPASLTQEQLFPLVSRLPEVNRTYTTYQAYRVSRPVDADALGTAVDVVVARHEALRTSLTRGPGGLQQVIHAAGTGLLRVVEVGSADPDVLAEKLRTEIETLFRVTTEPLSRFSLFRIAEDDHVVLAVVHHLVFDGWSFSVLWRELTALYRAIRAGEPPVLPPVRMQFADFVAGQRQWLGSEEARESIGYWLDELRGCAAGTTIPYDDMPGTTTGRAGARYPFALPADLTAELTSVARRERVTVAALAMLALYMVVRDEAGVDDVVLGIPMGNRLGTDAFDAMGFLVNAHAVRMRMPAGVPLRELARTCARKLHGAMAHQQVPLPAVLAASRTDPAGGLPSALFRVVFTFHNEPDTPLDLAGTESCWWEVEDRTRRADLTLHIGRRGDRLAGDVEYSTQLYRPETVERFVTRYGDAVRALVAGIDRPLRPA